VQKVVTGCRAEIRFLGRGGLFLLATMFIFALEFLKPVFVVKWLKQKLNNIIFFRILPR
jgi:hypothetical protein